MPEATETVVLGGGAMGALLAGVLAGGGEAVTVFDVDPTVVAAIRERGVLLREHGEQRRVAGVRATDRAEELAGVRTLFVFVKAHHTAAALERLRDATSPQTLIVTLQNGWGAGEIVAGFASPRQTLIGITYTSVTRRGPGDVERTAAGRTIVGPYERGAPLDEARAVAQRLTACGLETTADPDVATAIWRKLVLNAAAVAPAALTRLTAGRLTQVDATHRVVDVLAHEAIAVAATQGHRFDERELRDEIHAALRASGAGKPSMLQDVEAQRQTEIEAINGAIVRAARAAGVDVPWNEAMLELVRGLERSWEG